MIGEFSKITVITPPLLRACSYGRRLGKSTTRRAHVGEIAVAIGSPLLPQPNLSPFMSPLRPKFELRAPPLYSILDLMLHIEDMIIPCPMIVSKWGWILTKKMRGKCMKYHILGCFGLM